MKIYDCFNFFNELDILEIRFNVLYDHVDKFVLVESNKTHSGIPKTYCFEENKKRFSKFLDKIIIFKVTDTPEKFDSDMVSDDTELNKIYEFIKTTNRFNRQTEPNYGRDFFEKESVRRALIECDDDDVILLSDLDEIPNPLIFSKLHNLDLENTIYSFNQYTYYYYLNVLKQTDWCGTKMALYKNIKDKSFNEVRWDKSMSTIIQKCGWHFSFMGGVNMVKEKMKSYSHHDMATEDILNSLESNMNNLIDPFLRSHLTKVSIDESYPEYILNNLEKYKHLIM